MYIIGFIFKNFCCNLFFYRRFPEDMWLIFYYKFYYSFYYKAAENRGKQRITEDNGTFTKYREKAQKRYVSGLLKWLYYIIHKNIVDSGKFSICFHFSFLRQPSYHRFSKTAKRVRQKPNSLNQERLRVPDAKCALQSSLFCTYCTGI